MKAILILDNIQEEWFKDNLSCKFQLLYYPNGEMKELGISGKHHLKPLPEKKEIQYQTTDGITTVIDYEYTLNDYLFDKGYNTCIDEILGEEE